MDADVDAKHVQVQKICNKHCANPLNRQGSRSNIPPILPCEKVVRDIIPKEFSLYRVRAKLCYSKHNIEMDSFLKFLATPDLPEPGPGPRAGILSEEELNRSLDKEFLAQKISRAQTELIRALLLLWHDHLEAAHVIAQDSQNAHGSFIHGILHRREPDYSNAKYWFHRVGQHPCFPEIARRVTALLEETKSADSKKNLIPNGRWDAIAFIDFCQSAARRPIADGQHRLAREIQRIETEVLLEHLLKS